MIFLPLAQALARYLAPGLLSCLQMPPGLLSSTDQVWARVAPGPQVPRAVSVAVWHPVSVAEPPGHVPAARQRAGALP